MWVSSEVMKETAASFPTFKILIQAMCLFAASFLGKPAVDSSSRARCHCGADKLVCTPVESR
jgi:hypothetical protein